MSDWISPLTMEEIKAKCRKLEVSLRNDVQNTHSMLVEYLEHVDDDKKTRLEELRDEKLLQKNSTKWKWTQTFSAADREKKMKSGKPKQWDVMIKTYKILSE